MVFTGRKIAAAFLIILAVGQIPFSLIGLSFFVGLSIYGTDYLLILHHSLSGPGGPVARIYGYASPTDGSQVQTELDQARQARREPQSTTHPDKAETAEGPEVKPTPIDPAVLKSTKPDVPPMAELAPPSAPASLPSRRIADISEFMPSSEIAGLLTSNPDLVVDYVSIPARPVTSNSIDTPLEIALRQSEQTRLLVLVGRNGISWRFVGALPRHLVGVIVYASDYAGDETVFGLPDEIPLERFDQKAIQLPWVPTLVPQCAVESKTNLISGCSHVRRSGDDVSTSFDVAEEQLKKILGRPIATVSSAHADRVDRAVLVPEVVVDDFARRRAAELIDRYRRDLAERKHRSEVYFSYVKRWIEERRVAVRDEVARHPVPAPSNILAQQPRIIIVSTWSGTPELPENWAKREQVASYDDYQWNLLNTIGRVEVRVETQEPIVIFATSDRNVDWRFEVAENARILAVHVECKGAPSVSGIPDDVALTVRGAAFGDGDAMGFIPGLKRSDGEQPINRNVRNALVRIGEMYPGSQMTLYEDKALQAVALTNPLPSDGDKK